MTEHRPLDPPASTTIATIANDVGVSVATVSKVLNGRTDVAPGTRARVEAATREAGIRLAVSQLEGAHRPPARWLDALLATTRPAWRSIASWSATAASPGYDNLPVAAWTDPALTTINQPLHDMAGIATQMLLGLARGIEPATSRIDLVTELVVRESTAPPAHPR